MKLTSRSRYAVTAILDMALYAEHSPVALHAIAQRQGIPLTYLEQLFCRLRKQGIVSSVRGPMGGYTLGKSADTITIGMILFAVDETVDTTRCQGKKPCQNGARCLTHELWSSLNQKIHQFLSQITVEELMQHQAVQKVLQRQKNQLSSATSYNST